MTTDPDAALAERLSTLKLESATVADGLWGGVHRGGRQGASVVFRERRAYSPGDDPRLLDWRALARTDRPSVKRFDEEAELQVLLLLDRSPSMGWPDGEGSKLSYAATLMGALAHVACRQGDRVGLSTLDRELNACVAPSSRPGQLGKLLAALAATEPGGDRTDLEHALGELSHGSARRSVIVLASDLLDPAGLPAKTFRELAARGHELKVLHVLSRAELSLSGEGPARFVGLEGEPSVEADTARVKTAYLELMAQFLERARAACLEARASYALAATDGRPVDALRELLQPPSRAARRQKWG